MGMASPGIRIAIPVLLNLLLTTLAFCMVLKAPEDVRAGRLAAFMMITATIGMLQMVVALSAWDCSTGVKILVGIGTVETCVGLLFIAVKMAQAKMSGVGIFAAFTLERIIIVAVDSVVPRFLPTHRSCNVSNLSNPYSEIGFVFTAKNPNKLYSQI